MNRLVYYLSWLKNQSKGTQEIIFLKNAIDVVRRNNYHKGIKLNKMLWELIQKYDDTHNIRFKKIQPFVYEIVITDNEFDSFTIRLSR